MQKRDRLHPSYANYKVKYTIWILKCIVPHNIFTNLALRTEKLTLKSAFKKNVLTKEFVTMDTIISTGS